MPVSHPSDQSPTPQAADAQSAIPTGRMALLFTVMLVTAAGNTAMHSVMPSIGTALKIDDVWISLAYSWSALLWVMCAPMWARRSDKRGRKAMMALGLVGFIASMSLCGLVLWMGFAGWITGFVTLLLFALARSAYGGFGSAAPPAVQAYVASRTSRSERTKALSLVASSFGLGTVVGPVLAPLMIIPFFGIGLTGPAWCFALLGVVTLVVLRLRLPDDEPKFAARGKTFSDPNSGVADPDALEDDDPLEGAEENGGLPVGEQKRLRWFEPRLRHWVIASLAGGHAQAMIMGITGFLVLDRLQMRERLTEGAAYVSLVMVFGAIATLLAQWGIIPRFKLGPRAATLSGVITAAFGTAILAAHDMVPGDAMLIFSHSGLNAVTLDIAVGARERGMKLIGVTSIPHSSVTPSRHSCGKRLFELADVVIDTGVPLGDAGIEIDGMTGKTGATSTSIAIAIGHAINVATAERVVASGREPFIMQSPNTTDKVAATQQNDRNYAELARRLKLR